MIYDPVGTDEPIRQGDIFVSVPILDVQYRSLNVQSDDGQFENMSWTDAVAEQREDLIVLSRIVPTPAIVLTQDCDTVRAPNIALAQVAPFREVEPRSSQTTKASKWMSLITQHARINQKWYYLPPSDLVPFEDKMAADFRSIIRIPRDDLEIMIRGCRRCRLNTVALAHFRERIAEFFRRFPFDEWYPLDVDELIEYQKSKPEPIRPFPWQSK